MVTDRRAGLRTVPWGLWPVTAPSWEATLPSPPPTLQAPEKREPLPRGHLSSCFCHLPAAGTPVPNEEAEVTLLLCWLPSLPHPAGHLTPHGSSVAAPSPNTEAIKSLPCSWECPEPTCPLASFPHSHPPERDVHTHLHFLLPSSFLSPWPPRGDSEPGLFSAVSPLPSFSSPLSPRPSCLPQQVPLSAWVRVLPQKWQKFGGGRGPGH